MLDYVVAAAQREKIPGAWPDGWSPSHLLINHGFQDLLEANSVLAAGPDVHGGNGVLSVAIEVPREHVFQGEEEHLRREAVVDIPGGMSLLNGLAQAVQQQLRVVGNHHWGDVSDLQALSRHLRLGMLVFVDRLQGGGTQCLCTVDQMRGDFPFFIAIWWDDPQHFRLCQLSVGPGFEFRSSWPVHEIPAALAAHYDTCNPSARIRTASSIGVH